MADTKVKLGGRSNLNITLLDSTARTTSSDSEAEVGATLKILDPCIGATIIVDVTANSGTSETLNVYVQKKLPDGTWTDIAAFGQFTGTGKKYVDLAHLDASISADVSDKALTAGTTLVGSFGNEWQLAWTIGGTGPSFTFEAIASFFK